MKLTKEELGNLNIKLQQNSKDQNMIKLYRYNGSYDYFIFVGEFSREFARYFENKYKSDIRTRFNNRFPRSYNVYIRRGVSFE